MLCALIQHILSRYGFAETQRRSSWGPRPAWFRDGVLRGEPFWSPNLISCFGHQRNHNMHSPSGISSSTFSKAATGNIMHSGPLSTLIKETLTRSVANWRLCMTRLGMIRVFATAFISSPSRVRRVHGVSSHEACRNVLDRDWKM